MRLARCLGVAVAVALGWSVSARAQAVDRAPAPATSRQVIDTVGASVNTPGLQNALTVAWSRRLGTSDAPLKKDAHLTFGVSQLLAPSYARIAPWVEYAPLSILDVRCGIEPSVYFPTYGTFAPFTSYDQDYSWDTVSEMEGSSALAVRLYVKPRVRVRVGPIVAFVQGEVERWQTNADAALIYEPWRDTLIRAAGATLVSETDALMVEHAVSGGKWSVGVTHDILSNVDSSATRIERAGVLVIREFAGKRFGLRAPTFVASAAYYLNDPSKEGTVYAWMALSFRVR
jgi:hypothetical protein